MTFWVPSQWRVSAGLVILRKYTPVEFTLINSRVMTPSRPPQCRAFSRAVMDEKSLTPLFPVGGGGGRGYKWLVHYRQQYQLSRQSVTINIVYQFSVLSLLSRKPKFLVDSHFAQCCHRLSRQHITGSVDSTLNLVSKLVFIIPSTKD